MDYVYVVTVSARSDGPVGIFAGATPTAFEEQVSAELAAATCRNALGGLFALVDAEEEHVVERWDSDEFTVWLERLVFEAAQ